MRTDPLSDPLPLIQLGYAMFLDKPIVVLLPQGATLPEHLARAADRIIPFDPDQPGGLEQASAEYGKHRPRALDLARLDVEKFGCSSGDSAAPVIVAQVA